MWNWHSPRSQGEEDYRFQPEALITCKNRPISDEATVVLVFLCRSLSISCRVRILVVGQFYLKLAHYQNPDWVSALPALQ